MAYSTTLIKNAPKRRCCICYEFITKDEAEAEEFHYTKNGKKETFVHKKCWNQLYSTNNQVLVTKRI